MTQLAENRHNGRATALARIALLALAVWVAGCGGDVPDTSKVPSANPSASASAEPAETGAPDRQADDGEGIAKFIVDGFNEHVLGCDYDAVVEGLGQEMQLFVPDVQSSLLGDYSQESYTGPPDPIDSSVHSSENPPPTREEELANLLALFPNGRLTDGMNDDDPPAEWPFGADNDLDLGEFAGVSFEEVCRAGVRLVSGGDPALLKASYRRDGEDADGNPSYVLSFPRGSVPDESLRIEEARRLVVTETEAGWSILSFMPNDD